MERENTKEVLKLIGLNEKEAEIYLTLSEVGETTATKIAKEINVERTLVYYMLEKLINRGLVSYKLKNNIKYYSASPPGKMLDELQEKEKSFAEALPYLTKLQKQAYEEEVKVDVYKGTEGLKAIMNDMFKVGKTFLVMGEQGQIQDNYPTIYNHYLRRLEKTGIKEKVIVREDLRGKLKKSKNSELKYIAKELNSPTTTLVYADKVQITIWERPMFNILITSKKVADSYTTYFNQMWKIANK